MPCANSGNEVLAELCPKRAFWHRHADVFVAVVEEALLRKLLSTLAQAASPRGSPFPNIPSAVIALPGNASEPESPAPVDPLSEYEASGSTQAWNMLGSDLLKLYLPCAVFLAPDDQAGKLRAKAQNNEDEVRLRNQSLLSKPASAALSSLSRLLKASHASRTTCGGSHQ
jgi:hypothetical protein